MANWTTPIQQDDIEKTIRTLRNRLDRLRKDIDFTKRNIEAVQALCMHPETETRTDMKNDTTTYCTTCGKRV